MIPSPRRRANRGGCGSSHWLPPAAIAASAALITLAYGSGRLGYDALFALIWGRELARLELPSLDVAGAPTPHPLANVTAAALAPLGADASAAAMVGLACLALATSGYAAWLIGSRLLGPACGLLFAVLVLTRPGLVVALLYSSTDLWFVALVLIAGAQITNRPLNPLGPLTALALAGLLRPEAWALGIVYVVFLALRRVPPRRLVLAIGMALAAPVIWLLSDWVAAAEPLLSMRTTQELAVVLQRPRGPGAAIDLGAGYLAGLLGEPVLWIGLAGCIVVIALAPDRAALPAIAFLSGLAAFGTLAVVGLPLIGRYLVLPALALTFFAAAAMAGWTVLSRGLRRGWWAAAGVVLLAATASLVPAQVRELRDLRGAAGEQRTRQLELRSIANRLRGASPRCVVELPSPLDVPVIVLFAEIDPTRLATAGRLAPAPDLRVLESAPTNSSGQAESAKAGRLVLVASPRERGCWSAGPASGSPVVSP